MPRFPLGLNITWEAIYSYFELFGRGSVSILGFANAAWVILDAAIVVTYFRFSGNECQTKLERKRLVPSGILVIVVTGIICFVFDGLYFYE